MVTNRCWCCTVPFPEYLMHGSTPSAHQVCFFQHVTSCGSVILQHIMQRDVTLQECPLSCSQKSTVCPYPDAMNAAYSSHRCVKGHFNIFVPYMRVSLKWFVLFRYCNENSEIFLSLHHLFLLSKYTKQLSLLIAPPFSERVIRDIDPGDAHIRLASFGGVAF